MVFDHPLVQSVAVPFAVALAAMWGLRAACGWRADGAVGSGTDVGPADIGPADIGSADVGPANVGAVGAGAAGRRLAPAAAGIGLLASLYLMPGFATPVSAPAKLPWITAAALATALALTWPRRRPPRGESPRHAAPHRERTRREALRREPPHWLTLLAAAALLAGAGAWLGAATAAAFATLALGGLATVVVPLAPTVAGRRSASLPAVQAVAAAGLAGISIQAGSALLAQIAAAIAAASAAVALGNWPRPRDRFGAVSLLAIGVPTALLAWTLWRLTGVRPAALLVLAATCLAQAGAARLALPGRWRRNQSEPLAAALLAAVPAAAAIALAAIGADDDGSGPYLR